MHIVVFLSSSAEQEGKMSLFVINKQARYFDLWSTISGTPLAVIKHVTYLS